MRGLGRRNMKIPILRLGDVLLSSIQEDLTDRDALDFQGELLKEVTRTEAKGVVIDISAMDLVDTFLARALNDAATMVKLLGADVVLCGMQPAVSLTLVEMGRGLIGIEAALDLDQGVSRVRELISRQTTTGRLNYAREE